MHSCNGCCAFCKNPCTRGKIKATDVINFLSSPKVTKEEEKGAEEAFDAPIGTGVSVVENIGTYEVVKSIFGKEKVRKVK